MRFFRSNPPPELETATALQAQETEAANDVALIDEVAQAIVRRRLEVPAVIFLESTQPIAFFASQGLHFLTPFIGLFASWQKTARLAQLLDQPDQYARLIDRIEELAQGRPSAGITQDKQSL
jgi:hypothetical protein